MYHPQEKKREVVRQAYRERLAAGDRNIHLVDGDELISLENSDGQGDGCHPNDEGFARMSARLKTTLLEILEENLPG